MSKQLYLLDEYEDSLYYPSTGIDPNVLQIAAF